jgi:hypothetical protein
MSKIVTVARGQWGDKCNVPDYPGIPGRRIKCNGKSKYLIFGDDGATKLSRLAANPCRKHLPLAIDRILKLNEVILENRAKKKRR